MKTLKSILSTVGLVTVLPLTGFGQLILLETYGDEYIGGDPTNSAYDGADVIGTNNVFDLTGAEISYDLTSGSLEVKILGNYFDNILTDSSLLGTVMGDLFISTDGLSWNIGDNTDNDYYGSGTETSWEYAVQLGIHEQPGLTSGTEMDGKMIQITDPGAQIQLSSAGGIYRSMQEHQVTGDWSHNLTDPTWVIMDGSLAITINDFGDFFGSELNDMGFHWAMSCANDVIEFEFETGDITIVPEPATIGLLGLLGMSGILLLRRRFRRLK